MIKQIQLRGISRTPSDRTVEDGGCAESLNIHLEEGESAPTLPPVDETPAGLAATGLKVLYIHKGVGYTNYIGTAGGDLCAWKCDAASGTEFETIRENCADPLSVSANGNILVFTLPALEGSIGKDGYALFRNGAYIDLGDGAPIPTVTFDVTPQADERLMMNIGLDPLTNLKAQFGDSTAHDLWEYVIKHKSLEGESKDLYDEAVSGLWRIVDGKIKTDRASDIFDAPVLARYAVRLVGGSYIYNSEPVILAGSNKNLFLEDPLIVLLKDAGTSRWLYFDIGMKNRFKVTVSASFGLEADNWMELIESVDVFLSTDVRVPKHNSELSFSDETTDNATGYPASLTTVGGSSYVNYEGVEYRIEEGGVHIPKLGVLRDAFEEEYVNKANYYLVASYKVSDLPSGETIKPVAQDDLVVKQRLSEADSHRVGAYGAVRTFNRRTMSGQQLVTLSKGHREPHAILGGLAVSTVNYYTIVYHVRDEAGIEHIVLGYDGAVEYAGASRGYVAYPDPRCYQADIYVGAADRSFTAMTVLPMKEHPRLNCSYGFWGLDTALEDVTGDRTAGDPDDFPDDDSGFNPSFFVNNRLALSEIDTPFVFPLAQRQTYQDEIIDAAPITKPLSTSQFGYAAIYVFTRNGIWAQGINDEGGLGNQDFVSGDVACDGTICQLDQAIAFVTKQGVMIITGSDPVNISPYMNGRHYSLDTSIATALATTDWAGVVASITETPPTPFMSFAKDCRIAYDYSGRRILLLKGGMTYQYVYMLDTQTWHKISADLPRFVILNSFPDCKVSTYKRTTQIVDDVETTTITTKVLDFSTELDKAALLSDTATPVRGLIVTRSLDLGQPDVRKAVKDLRIRGRFNKGDVLYMMLGSFDGIKWTRLLTKGGGSYNLFRFVILTNLSPTERISWIDVEFEPRFANKLR